MRTADYLRRHLPVRRYDAGDLLDVFIVSAISALLLIRFFLRLTGYPQLGGEHLHISHLLWGGLLMLVALLILLTTLTRSRIHAAALIGGVGFGTFIDELGKLLTHDADYFFQPSIALIYLLFVLLYVASRALGRRLEPTPESALINALELTKEAVSHDMDRQEKEQALWFLSRSDPTHPVVPVLRRLLEETMAVPARTPGPLARARGAVRALYLKISRRRSFSAVALAVVVLGAAAVLAQAMSAVEPSSSRTLEVGAWGQLLSALVVAALVATGIAFWFRSRLRAYRFFHRATLVAICVTQVFAFYREQLGAVVGLVAGIVIWNMLRALIGQEERISGRPPGEDAI